jgi:flagellar motor switch/type III secretory pathway protein FliN
MLLRDLINLETGDVVSFDFPAAKPLDLRLNGAIRYVGEMVSVGRRAGFRVLDLVKEDPQ